MLDYTLVSAIATYRMPTPRDTPRLVQLAQALHREDPGPERSEMTADKVLATVSELGRSKDRGSVFVFEREGTVVGYAIIILYWSNEMGGIVLVIDELYVDPAQRGNGIATDFVTLLGKVAPQGVVAMQLEVTRTNRRVLELYRKLGFRDTGRQLLTFPIERP